MEMPTEMKRSLEALVLEYKRRRNPELRSLTAVVCHACDQLLRRDLPGYLGGPPAAPGERAVPAQDQLPASDATVGPT